MRWGLALPPTPTASSRGSRAGEGLAFVSTGSRMARMTRHSTHPPGREAKVRPIAFVPVRLSTKAEASAVHLRIADQAEAFPVHLGSLLFGRSLKQFTVRKPVAAEALAVSRSSAPAKALAVHRSGRRIRQKPSRFAFSGIPCQPELVGLSGRNPVSAEADRCPSWIIAAAEALAILLRNAVSAEADRFFRTGSPSRPEPRRFSIWQFRGARKLQVPPGCLPKHAVLAKAWGKPERPHGGGFVSRPRLHVPFLSLRSEAGAVRQRPDLSSRGAIDPATTGTCHENVSRQSTIGLWIIRITGISPDASSVPNG